jgi:hypothetical protein
LWRVIIDRSLAFKIFSLKYKEKRNNILTNIIDGMDAARFKTLGTDQKRQQNVKEKEKRTPMVLKNLKNGS